MKLLITGGFGYLGANLANLLSEKGYKIRILSLNPPKNYKKKGNYEVVIGNILDSTKMREACKGIDFALHLAAIDTKGCVKDPELCREVNVNGTRNVLEAAANAKAKRFVYMSTIHVYGEITGRLEENMEPRPTSEYAKSKLLGEKQCRLFGNGMKCIIVRLSNAYGAPLTDMGYDLAVNNFCRQAVDSQKIILKTKGSQKRDFVSVSDIAEAIDLFLQCGEEELEGTYNLGGGKQISIYELAKLVADLYYRMYGKKVEIGFDKALVEEKISDFEYDLSRIKKLGYAPKADLKEEIRKTLEAFGKNG